jgi:hypothetical protein
MKNIKYPLSILITPTEEDGCHIDIVGSDTQIIASELLDTETAQYICDTLNSMHSDKDVEELAEDWAKGQFVKSASLNVACSPNHTYEYWQKELAKAFLAGRASIKGEKEFTHDELQSMWDAKNPKPPLSTLADSPKDCEEIARMLGTEKTSLIALLPSSTICVKARKWSGIVSPEDSQATLAFSIALVKFSHLE